MRRDRDGAGADLVADRRVRFHRLRPPRLREDRLEPVPLREYGDTRTLLSYEARTEATDETARRAFLRYWTLVSPGVGIVMRSLLSVIELESARGTNEGAVVDPDRGQPL